MRQMRPDILVGGIIILIMGIVGHSWMKNYITDCTNSVSTTSPVSSYLSQICDQLKLMQIGTIFSVAAGFCIMIYGSIARKQLSKN